MVWKENRGGLPQDIVVFGEKSRKKSGKKWPFLTSIFWPFHRCETGKRGYGVKFQMTMSRSLPGRLLRLSVRFMSIGGNGSVQRIPACIRTGMHSAAGFSAGSVGQNFADRKSTSESRMKKSSGVVTSILKTVRNAARRQSVRTSSRLHFLGSGTG